MDWDKLKTFHAAIEAGSLTGAADTLTLLQSAVSRQIAALERQLGVSLFHRHARGLHPTEQGRILHAATRDMAARALLAEAALADSRDSPSGDLHVTAPIAFGSTWLVPRLRRFMSAYPELRLDLALDDEEVDMSTFEVDVALRLRRPTQPDLIQRPLLSVRQSLYAAPSYLAAHGRPTKARHLDDHALVVYGAKTANPLRDIDWALHIDADAPRQPTLKVNTIFGVMRAIEAGLGIGSLPDYVAENAPQLERVLPDLHGPDFTIYFVYPEELRGSRRIEVLRDFLLREAAAFSLAHPPDEAMA